MSNRGTTADIASLKSKAARSWNLSMPTQRDHENDMSLLTPLLLMAIGIACGFLFIAYRGHMLLAQR
jgi:hypothetical protein